MPGEEYPEFLTAAQIKTHVPELTAKMEMVALGDRIYKREDGRWRCLDYQETSDGR